MSELADTHDVGDDEFDALLRMRTGHLLLESGHHGELWLELDLLFSAPRRIEPWADELAELLRPCGVDVVCGPLTGGALLAQLVARRLDVGLVWTEKPASVPTRGLFSAQYRLPQAQRGLLPNRRIAVVDDVINAGSATRATVAEIDDNGGRVVALGALLVLGDRATEYAESLNVPLLSLGRRDSPIWTPEDCPLCARSVPLDDMDDGTS